MRTIYPQPGFTVEQVRDIINSKNFIYVDCYTIVPRSGSTLRVNTTTQPISVVPLGEGGLQSFDSSARLQVTGLKFSVSVGTEVDEQEMQLNYTQDATLFGLPVASALRIGLLDGATIKRDRYFRKTWSTPWAGGCRLFQGRTSSIDSFSRFSGTVKVKSDLILLNIQLPKELYQASCVHTIYDAGCTLNREDFVVSGVVGAGSDATKIMWAGANSGFISGTIYIERSGITYVRTIREVDTGKIVFTNPLDFVPNTGDPFEAYPGCIRTYARCGELNNQSHFRGFPFIPVAETAY